MNILVETSGRDAGMYQYVEHLFGEDTCPDYVERWGGMHRQAAMEGPTRKALEMAMDSEWATDSWADTPTPTSEPGTPTVSC